MEVLSDINRTIKTVCLLLALTGLLLVLIIVAIQAIFTGTNTHYIERVVQER